MKKFARFVGVVLVAISIIGWFAVNEYRHQRAEKAPRVTVKITPESGWTVARSGESLAFLVNTEEVILFRPTATVQVFGASSYDEWSKERWLTSTPNIIAVKDGVMWPLNYGVADVCLEGKCFRVKSRPDWTWPRSPQHIH